MVRHVAWQQSAHAPGHGLAHSTHLVAYPVCASPLHPPSPPHPAVSFKRGKPFTPFEQLLAVLPSASAAHLPEPFRPLMTEANSPILDFYPTEFEMDMEGKRADWEAVVMVPFVDEARLSAAAASISLHRCGAAGRACACVGGCWLVHFRGQAARLQQLHPRLSSPPCPPRPALPGARAQGVEPPLQPFCSSTPQNRLTAEERARNKAGGMLFFQHAPKHHEEEHCATTLPKHFPSILHCHRWGRACVAGVCGGPAASRACP